MIPVVYFPPLIISNDPIRRSDGGLSVIRSFTGRWRFEVRSMQGNFPLWISQKKEECCLFCMSAHSLLSKRTISVSELFRCLTLCVVDQHLQRSKGLHASNEMVLRLSQAKHAVLRAPQACKERNSHLQKQAGSQVWSPSNQGNVDRNCLEGNSTVFLYPFESIYPSSLSFTVDFVTSKLS